MTRFDGEFRLFGKKVAEYRKKAGLTQQQFAIKLGISREHLGHIEVGIKHPSFELIFLIAKTLNIQTRDLFDF